MNFPRVVRMRNGDFVAVPLDSCRVEETKGKEKKPKSLPGLKYWIGGGLFFSRVGMSC